MSNFPHFPAKSVHQNFAALEQRVTWLEQVVLTQQSQSTPVQSILAAVSQIRHSLEREEVLRATVAELQQLFHADRVIVINSFLDQKYSEGEVVAEAVSPGFSSMLHTIVQCQEIEEHWTTEPAQGQVVAIDDVAARQQLSPWNKLFQFQIQSSLTSPIFVKDSLWGIISVHCCANQYHWHPQDIYLLTVFSQQVGTALQQAELLTEADRRSAVLQTSLIHELRKRANELTLQTEREKTITRVIRKIRQTLDAETIFSTATGETRALLKCDRVSLYRFNPDWSGEFIWESVADGWRPLVFGKDVRTLWADSYLQETKGGRYRQQESFAVEDVYRTGHTPCHLEILEQFQIRAYCVVPVFVGTTLWGLMAAYHHSNSRSWDVEEVNLLARIGSQVGVAVQHTQAMEQLRLQSQQLQQAVERERAVAKIIDKIRRSLDIDTLFQTTTQEVRQLVQADRVAIYRFNPDWSGRFVVESVAPGWKSLLEEQREDSDLCRNVSECSIKKVATAEVADTYLQETQGSFDASSKPFRIVEDIYESNFSDCYIQLLESLQARAYAIVAIYQGQELWGLLAAYQNAEARQWQRNDVQFLLEIGSHLGVALQQAELLGQAEKRSTLLQTTLETQLRERAEELERETKREKTISKVIEKIRDSLDINTIFHTTATEVRQLLNADRVAMLRFIPGTQWQQSEFVAEDVLPQYLSAMKCKVQDHCFAEHRAQDYRQGCVWALEDVQNAPLKDCYLAILSRFQVRANLVVPLVKGDDLWGLLCIHQCSAPRQWQQQEKEFVVHIATQLGVALQQAEFLKQLQEAKDAADAANSAKSKFLANMSHELRTPLNAILGFAQVMARDPSLTPEQKEPLEIIGRSGEHLLALINDVLEMSKIEAGQLTLNDDSFDFYHLLQSLEEMLELKAESKGLQLIFECATDVPQYIRADKSKLRQVLINLLGNGIKFTQTGYVKLWIRAICETRQPETESSWRSPLTTCMLYFEVSDTGPGIAAEELSYLFEAFAQTETGRRSQEGTGLGLPISQTFVRRMGGEITVETVPGSGSTFRFHIPVSVVDESEVAMTKPDRQVIGLQAGHPIYRILVAEDKWENRQLLVRLLTTIGFEVREATNGQEAIDCCQKWNPHLIWMDMRMPVMDGYEATRYIKTHYHNDAPVILALTANAFEEERLVALSLGCDDFIRKPCQENVILEKMAEYLEIHYIYNPFYNHSTATTVETIAPLPVPVVPSQSSITSPTSLSILVAEDNLVNQKLMARMLEQMGHSVDVVSNGVQVLEAVQQRSYEIILMDVQMPIMDGLSAAQRIRQQGIAKDSLYIIAMTGRASVQDQEECLSAGMNHYLAKPIKIKLLEQVLQEFQTHQVHRSQQPKPLSPEPLNPVMIQQLHDLSDQESTSFFVSMIETFFEEAPKYLRSIEQAILEGDVKLLSFKAHSLKNISAHLGSTAFAQLCGRLERINSIESISNASDLLNTINQTYEQFKLSLMLQLQQATIKPNTNVE